MDNNHPGLPLRGVFYRRCAKNYIRVIFSTKGAVPRVMSVALIELVEMTATLNVVVSINSTTVMQTYWTASLDTRHPGSPLTRCFIGDFLWKNLTDIKKIILL